MNSNSNSYYSSSSSSLYSYKQHWLVTPRVFPSVRCCITRALRRLFSTTRKFFRLSHLCTNSTRFQSCPEPSSISVGFERIAFEIRRRNSLCTRKKSNSDELSSRNSAFNVKLLSQRRCVAHTERADVLVCFDKNVTQK